jgi:hypothetical protein
VTILQGLNLGLLFCALLYLGWLRRSPKLLYAFAALGGVVALTLSLNLHFLRVAPYFWVFALGLAGAGYMLRRAR